MSRAASIQLRRIRQQLDTLALEQLREEAARLVVDNEDLRRRLANAEDAAEFWREDAADLADKLMDTGVRVGLTQAGQIVTGPAATLRPAAESATEPGTPAQETQEPCPLAQSFAALSRELSAQSLAVATLSEELQQTLADRDASAPPREPPRQEP